MKFTSKRSMRRLVAPILAAVWLSGCSQVITTTLPDLTPSDRPVLSSAEQERAIKEMIEKKNQSAIENDPKAKTP